MVALRSSSTDTVSRWPSRTVTRLQAGLMAMEAGATVPASALTRAEHLERLDHHLFFFLTDVRDHIVQRVERGNAGVPRAREGLHGGHHDPFQAESIIEWLERHSQAHGGAVGVGDDESIVPAPDPSLVCQHRQVVSVHLRDEQGHIRVHAVRAGVAEHAVSGGGKTLFDQSWPRWPAGPKRRGGNPEPGSQGCTTRSLTCSGQSAESLQTQASA